MSPHIHIRSDRVVCVISTIFIVFIFSGCEYMNINNIQLSSELYKYNDKFFYIYTYEMIIVYFIFD